MVQWDDTQPGAAAQPLPSSAAWRQPAGKRPCRRVCQRGHLRCETQPGAPAQPLSRLSAAWRQPAGKRPCRRAANALASAGTFGAKHSRGLPPNRSAACQPHGGSLRANGPADAPPTPLPARAPSVRNAAGGCRPTAQPLVSRMAAACGRTAVPAPLPARAPSVRNTAGGCRPTAQPLVSRMAAACGRGDTANGGCIFFPDCLIVAT